MSTKSASDLAIARCHLLAEVLSADGMMNDSERQVLEDAMGRQGLDDQARDRVRHFEEAGGAIGALCEQPEEARRALLDELVDAALVDGKLTPAETAAVKRIATNLGLD
jgi:uncharacterized tellurite resistance protein B-like protein